VKDPLAKPAPLVKRVYAYVAYRIGDGPDAEDVTSETFERALRYRDSFDPRRGSATSWLIGIARRCIADAALKRELPTDTVPEQLIEGHEDRSHLKLEVAHALATLDERDRELIALRYGADLTAKQIAELLELKTNAVEVALHRVLARLRTRVDPGEPRPEPTAQPVIGAGP
jgi:RNA polymerase sigma factor (sigma-70 family)